MARALFFLAIALCVGIAIANEPLVNTRVERTIDLKSHLARITAKVTIQNNGAASIASVHVGLESALASKVAFVSVKEQAKKLNVGPAQLKSGAAVYRVDLAKPLGPGDSVTLTVKYVVPKTQQPFPAEITQSDKQLVRYFGSAYYYSPYPTKSQSTKYELASSRVESFTRVAPSSASGSTVSYGPYENIAASSESEVVIHFENNSPFLTVRRMTRDIELSHWGNVAIEESFELEHTGARLKGSFSRYDYQRGSDSGVSSIREFTQRLPRSAADVYYRDLIGNISTSHFRTETETSIFEIRPRFPLFGGWKVDFYTGYNLPSNEYLFREGSEFVLRIPFVGHVFDNAHVEQLTVRFVLPEGVNNVRVVTPYAVDGEWREQFATYLDVAGRTVVVVTKTNLVDEHAEEAEVHYEFSQLLMLQEPLLVVGFFYALFLAVIGYVRLDFSIGKVSDRAAGDANLKAATVAEQLYDLQETRAEAYGAFDAAISSARRSKNRAAIAAAKKTLDVTLKEAETKHSALVSSLEAVSKDAAERARDVLRKERERQSQWAEFGSKAERGELSEDKWAKAEDTFRANIARLESDIDNAVNTLTGQ